MSYQNIRHQNTKKKSSCSFQVISQSNENKRINGLLLIMRISWLKK